MALRYTCKACAVAQAGTTHAHGLGAVPDEWSINLRGPGAGAACVYVGGAPDATNIIVTASGAAGTCDVFASVSHSIIK